MKIRPAAAGRTRLDVCKKAIVVLLAIILLQVFVRDGASVVGNTAPTADVGKNAAPSLSARGEPLGGVPTAKETVSRTVFSTPQPTPKPSTPKSPTPAPLTAKPSPTIASVTADKFITVRRLKAASRTEDDLGVLVDGDLDTWVWAGDRKSPACLDIYLDRPAAFRQIIVHMHKNKYAHVGRLRNLTVQLYQGDTLVYCSQGFYWGHNGVVLSHPDYVFNEELLAKVPPHAQVPVNRVRVYSKEVDVRLSEVDFYTTSDSVPTPVRWRKKERVLWRTAGPSAKELADIKQSCPLREPTPVSVFNMSNATVEALVVDKKFDCVVATALFGKIEKAMKAVAPQTHECELIVFTDREDLKAQQRDTRWRVVTTPYHLHHRETLEFLDAGGRTKGKRKDFLKAKFYKQQAHRLMPKHIKYLIWLDGTVEITGNTVFEKIIRSLNEDASIGSLAHERDNVILECIESMGKYHQILNKFDLLMMAYLNAVRDGFCEGFWLDGGKLPNWDQLRTTLVVAYERDTCPPKYRSHHTLLPLVDELLRARSITNTSQSCRPMGIGLLPGEASDVVSAPPEQGIRMALTCLVSMDLRKPFVHRFMDSWWQSTFWHWQDQVTFPIASWRFGIIPKLLNGVLQHGGWVKHDHGL